MRPFNKDYILDKIEEYNEKISFNEVGNYKISKNQVKSINEGYLYKKNEEYNIDILELSINNESIMKIDPKEIQSTYQFIKYAEGTVGLVGLGLGYVVQELAKKDSVKKIIVYEISEEVIKLYKQNFNDNKKIEIHLGDAYKAKKEKFDFFFVDTYGYEFTKKVADDYKIFTSIHDIKEYCFWGLEHFLLSCRYEEIVWVYIPELWMEMSKNIFTAISNGGYLNEYYQLDGALVSEVLSIFKDLLDD